MSNHRIADMVRRNLQITRMIKKRHIVLLLFFGYVILLFALADQFEFRDQNLIGKGFATRFGEGLGLFFRYIIISFLSSSTFLILAFFLHNRLSIVFILLAPFLNIAVAFVVGLLLDFILWLAQLGEVISIFQKIFIIATVSTIVTTLWLLGDMFKIENERDMHTT